MRPAQQEWVCGLPVMQQSVLFAAVRAPDGIRKDHAIKVLMRWYRRCILLSAFEGKALDNPFDGGGGSFTGPFTAEHVSEYVVTDNYDTTTRWWASASSEDRWTTFNRMRLVYLRHVDELPHHFQLHLMHAAEIIGYEHPDWFIRQWWLNFYLMIVSDAHLFPESREQMNRRLSDNEATWREREEVIAK